CSPTAMKPPLTRSSPKSFFLGKRNNLHSQHAHRKHESAPRDCSRGQVHSLDHAALLCFRAQMSVFFLGLYCVEARVCVCVCVYCAVYWSPLSDRQTYFFHMTQKTAINTGAHTHTTSNMGAHLSAPNPFKSVWRRNTCVCAYVCVCVCLFV
ncbi:unnamed protein product, partial [Tetraodon nigroviridis]